MQSHHAPSVRSRHATTGRRARRRVTPAVAAGGVLAFIDARTAVFAPLAGDAIRHPGLMTLGPRRGWLRQIADRVALTPGVRAIVLVARALPEWTASPDQLAALREIGRALGPEGVVLLHHCASADHQEHIEAMARLARIRIVGLAGLPDNNGEDAADSLATRARYHADA